MSIKTVEWIGVGFSIVGLLLNAWKSVFCWPVWIFSDVFFIYVAVKIKNKPQIVLWMIFIIANIYAWHKWLS